jgi:hypothetical protein
MHCALLLAGLLCRPIAKQDPIDSAPTASRFSVGVEGGINYCNLQGNGNRPFLGAFNSVFTFHVGGYGCYRFAPLFAVQTGLYYSRKGLENPEFQSPAAPDTRLDYVTLPLLLKAMPTERFSLYAGPQIAMLLGGRNGSQSLDMRQSGFRRLDASAVVGAEVRVGPAWLGTRCDVSFLALNPTGAATTQSGQQIQLLAPYNTYRNQVLQAYLKLCLTKQ